jgi:hypothetical protein
VAVTLSPERGLKARLVEPDDPAWHRQLLETRHDFYHLPGYAEVSARQDGGVARAILVEGEQLRMLLPIVLRTVADGLHDATSPYGYPGPLFAGERTPDLEQQAWQATRDLLASDGIVSLFVRLHPLLDDIPPDAAGTVVRHGETVAVDLTLAPDEQWSQTRRNHRQQIRQAQEAGLVVRIDEWADLDGFKTAYRETMLARGADRYYLFGDEYFSCLRDALGDTLHIAAAHLDGELAAAALFVETGGIVEMHLTGHLATFARVQPLKLVFHEVRTYASARGNQVLHLGGGRGGAEDSLLHFKAGFSPRRLPFRTLRVVARAEDYSRLVGARDPGLDPLDLTGSFPAYRYGDVPQAR